MDMSSPAVLAPSAPEPLIHPTAIIDRRAQLHPTVRVGAFSVIGPDVHIDADTEIGPHVVISRWTRIGQRNQIFQFASIGEACQDLKYHGEETWLEIGHDNRIREFCTLHRGTVQDQAVTRVGNNNLLMVNTHIAHDCQIGDSCVFANNVGVAGHVTVNDHVIVGGNSGIHQFCQVGTYSMIGASSYISKDVPAFVMASGNPARACGMNTEGMRRRQWSSELINTLRQAYQVIYRQGLTTEQALSELENDWLAQAPEIGILIDSIRASQRGIIR